MSAHTFEKRTALAATPAALYAYHAADGAFARLTPPWEPVRILRGEGPFETRRVTLRMGVGPVGLTWVAQHGDAVPGAQFVDRQERGPFAAWEHRHLFEPRGDGSVLHDAIHYALPLGPFGAAGQPFVRRKLARMFAYRHAVTAADLERHARTPRPLTLALAGEGRVHDALDAFLRSGGHRVLPATEDAEARVVALDTGAQLTLGARKAQVAFGALVAHDLRVPDPRAPWIALDDAVGAVHHLLVHAGAEGPFAACNVEPGKLQGRDLRALGFSPRLPTLEQARAFELGEAGR